MDNNLDEAAKEHANSLGYQSDKEQYTTTPWAERNIREEYFKKGAKWQSSQPTVTEGDGWVSEKPGIKEDCIVLTAQWFEDYKYWEYKIWVVEKQYTNEGWYWGLFTGDGDHWGIFADLEAKKYKIIMHPPQPLKTIK